MLQLAGLGFLLFFSLCQITVIFSLKHKTLFSSASCNRNALFLFMKWMFGKLCLSRVNCLAANQGPDTPGILQGRGDTLVRSPGPSSQGNYACKVVCENTTVHIDLSCISACSTFRSVVTVSSREPFEKMRLPVALKLPFQSKLFPAIRYVIFAYHTCYFCVFIHGKIAAAFSVYD